MTKKEYEDFCLEILSAKMYDGRGKGVDLYDCEKCGSTIFTKYEDKGVTPFTMRCTNCGKGAAVHRKTIKEQNANIMQSIFGVTIHKWIRPNYEQFKKLENWEKEHVLNGGLMLNTKLKP